MTSKNFDITQNIKANDTRAVGGESKDCVLFFVFFACFFSREIVLSFPSLLSTCMRRLGFAVPYGDVCCYLH